jgi:hypothetical protein
MDAAAAAAAPVLAERWRGAPLPPSERETTDGVRETRLELGGEEPAYHDGEEVGEPMCPREG